MLEKAWIAVGVVAYLLTFVGGWKQRYRWYLLPMLPWLARSWFLSEPVKALRFFSVLVEGLRGVRPVRDYLDRESILLVVFAATTFLPALTANSVPDALNTLMFSAGLMMSAGYRVQMIEDMQSGVPIADRMLVAFTALAWFYKFAYGYQLDIGPLLVRGGGVYASNQYIGIALCLLPFVRSRTVALLALGTILLQFSRGGYLALILVFVLSNLTRLPSSVPTALESLIRWGSLVKLLAVIAAGVVALVVISPDTGKFLMIRLIGGGAFGINLEIAESLARLPLSDLMALANQSAQGDDRKLIWAAALQIATDNNWIGVGAGNFSIAATALNSELLYSNAHNLFLTLLAELGGGPCVVFILLLLRYAIAAWQYQRTGFVTIITFAVYGLFSGQIYETSSEVSIAQFIVLLHVFAQIDHARAAVTSERASPASAPPGRDPRPHRSDAPLVPCPDSPCS